MAIKLRKVLREMEKPFPFSIQAVMFNRGTRIGGEVRNYSNCELVKASSSNNPNKPGKSKLITRVAEKRNPNHKVNSTRNIRVIENGEIKKINIHLITQFNGEVVIP